MLCSAVSPRVIRQKTIQSFRRKLHIQLKIDMRDVCLHDTCGLCSGPYVRRGGVDRTGCIWAEILESKMVVGKLDQASVG